MSKINNLFDSSFEYAAIGKAIVSLEGKWLRVNESICKMLGYTKEDLLQIDFQTLTHPEDLERDLSKVQDLIEGKIKSYQIEKKYFHKNGSTVYVILSVSLIRDEENIPQFFISEIQDITNLKQTEAQLKDIIDATIDGYWDWKINEDYQYMSPRFWEMLGYSAEEKKHHPNEWQKLIYEEDLDLLLKIFDQHVKSKGQTLYSEEVRFRHKNGNTVWVHTRGKVVEWDKFFNPIRMVGMHTDITSFKRIEEKLRIEQEIKAHTYRLATLGDIAKSLIHEINNPLAVLIGYVSILKKYIVEEKINSTHVNTSLEHIVENVNRIKSIVSGLKGYAHDSDNDDKIEFKINDLIQEVILLNSSKYKNNKVELILPEVSKLDVIVFGNKGMIVKAVLNVFNNAIEAVSKLNERWVRFDLRITSTDYQIIIEDSGSGLSKEMEDKIMKPFFTTKPNSLGSGMGLNVAKNLVEKQNGDIYLDTNSQNTRFVIKLPKNKIKVAS